MARCLRPFAAGAALFVMLSGCSLFERPQRPAWRTQAENTCIAQKLVQTSAYIQPAREIDGPGICGLTHPFKVTALAGGTVLLNSPAILDCSMTAALDQWIIDVLQPSAEARFGQKIVQINSMGAFSCRSMNNQAGARLSEHGFGNAIDIGGFVLANGRSVTVVRDWNKGDDQSRAFLREIHAGSCGFFTTVLGPGSNAFHYDHIHVDLAQHGNTSQGPRRICKPVPQPGLLQAPLAPKDNLPDPPMLEDDLDIAQPGPASGPSMMVMHPVIDTSAQQIPLAYSVPVKRPSGYIKPAPHVTAGMMRPMPPKGYFRDDGVFVPEGKPSEWDITSGIPH